MTNVVPHNPRRPRTLWLDTATGRGLDDDGRPGMVTAGEPVTLADVLRGVERTRAERVMLTGPMLSRTQLLTPVEGWTAGAMFLDHELPVGRYAHELAGLRVEVRRAAEWFGDGDYGVETARSAERALAQVYAAEVPGGALFRSPGATGRDAWLRSIPRTKDTGELQVPEQVSLEVAELLRATSPQHRIERMAPPSEGATMPGLWYLDGRWMYAALCRELGTGPARWLTGPECEVADTYARNRYRVRFTAPHGWDAPGILMAKAGDSPADGWHCPMSGETWADAAEVTLARRNGWHVEFLEGLAFTKGRPLDTWVARLVRARDRVDERLVGDDVAPMVRAAIRSMLLHAIGAWHSSGRDETTVTAGPMMPPAGDGWSAPEPLETGGVLWRRRHGLSAREQAMTHPEWSAQVWGRAHARILEGPTDTRGLMSGALYLKPGTLVGIYGDAVMTTERPHWADLDDGKPGRLRTKGHVCGPIPWPTTARERDRLARQADAAGTTCKGDCS